MRLTEPAGPVTQNWRSSTGVRVNGDRVEHVKTSDASLAAEAAVLRDERDAGSDGVVAAVPFISYDPQANVLITEHVQGQTLFNVLWNGTGWPHWSQSRLEARTLTLAAARWLEGFHRRSRHGCEVGRDVPECRMRILESIERKIVALTYGLFAGTIDHRLADSVRRHVAVLAEAPGWEALDVGVIHGDFEPNNMLVTPEGRVFVIDFADTRIGLHLEDVVRLWTVVWELSQCGNRRDVVFRPLLPEILALNHLQPEVQQSAPFQLLRLWNAVTKLLQVRVLSTRMRWSTRMLLWRQARAQQRWLERACASGKAA